VCDHIYLADVVRLVGMLDLATAPKAERALRSALETRSRRPLIVDVSEVNFCDSSGLHALGRVNEAAQVRGRRMILRRPPVFLRRTIELAGPPTVFTIEDQLSN
jgi:anti-sigma B factor antagonist